MPTYEYRCKDCGHQFEIVQSFTDDALSVCPECEGALKKVYGAVGISFKGSGFYKTDSRGSSSSTSASSTNGSTSTSSSDSSSSGDSSSGSSGSSSGDGKATASASTSSSSSTGD